MISRERVLAALSHVEDPDLKKDLVTLGMIEDLVIRENEVAFTVMLTTPACPMKDMIKNACINAIHHLVDSEATVSVTMSAKTLSSREGSNFLSGVRNIIGIASGKGGVGKSSVAVNLAVGLHKLGASVGILDADIHGPSIPRLLGITNEQVHFFESGEKKIMQPIIAHGVKSLSIGLLTDPDQAIVWRGPMISSALRQLIQDADWGDLDYLIIDLPPGTGDIHITLSQNFPVSGVLLVTTPQKVASDDAIKAAAMFKMPGVQVPLIGVVENMSYFSPPAHPEERYAIFGEGGGKLISEKFNIPLLGQIPILLPISNANDMGMPNALAEDSAFMELAGEVARQLSLLHSGRNIMNIPHKVV